MINLLILSSQGYFNSFLERDISVQTLYMKGDYTLIRVQFNSLQDLPDHLSVLFVSIFAPSISPNYSAKALYRLSYELLGAERTGRSGVSCLCTFANPYSLAGCTPVDLNLVIIASPISSFFFMTSNSLFMSFLIFMITLSVRFLLSLNYSACKKNFNFFSYVVLYRVF